jgi:hypothetical protein
VQLDGYPAGQDRGYSVIDLLQAFLGQIARKKHNRAVARALLIGDILVPVFSGDRFAFAHDAVSFHSLSGIRKDADKQ